jgi:predicted secreted hydrolase
VEGELIRSSTLTGMRRVLVVTTLAIFLVMSRFSAAAGPQAQFPRAHFGHPQSSIEWWYSSALARDTAGTRYLVFFALFSGSGTLASVSQVTNLSSGATVGHSEKLAFGTVGPSSLAVRAGATRLSYSPRSDTWAFSAGGPGYTISLRQRATKPYALHGNGTGLIRQSLAGSSNYYSATRLAATGTLRADGKTLRLTGESWLDHQWGDFRDDARAYNWDWFSCRFDDRTELMLYQFRDRKTGRPLEAYRSGTWVLANGTTRGITGFDAEHGPRVLRAAGRAWPLDWQLSVPSLRLSESVRAIVPDQLVRNNVLPTFWEGASAATGSRTGTCVVELSYR